MITAETFKKAQSSIDSAKQQAISEMPNGEFVFIGMDNESIYFRVVAKLSKITKEQIEGIKVKTRFSVTKEITRGLYSTEFKMLIR